MRYYHKKYLNTSLIIVLLLSFFISGNLSAHMITDNSDEAVSVSLNIVDENGDPVPGVKVMIGEKIIIAVTGEEGSHSFQVSPDDIVTLSAPGFETSTSPGREIIQSDMVSLTKSTLFTSPDDDVTMPYMTIKKRHLTGSYNVIKGESLMSYPTTDTRLSFNGQVPGIRVIENNGAPGNHPAEQRGYYQINEKVSIAARGRDLTYIIDGVPAHVSEVTLDPGEIESVTVIKDIVGKAMYGPLAADGVMLITTRRGKTDEPYLGVNIETGTNVIDRFPEWVSGAEYAQLNNMAREADGIDPLYSSGDINAYAKNDPYDLKYPSINYRDYMLSDTRTFQRANITARGGSEGARYSSYLGYNREGDIFKIGSESDYNRLNLRSNLDIKINDFISTKLDINGSVGIRRSPGYGYTTGEGQTLMGIYEFDVALPDIMRTSPIEFPVYANNDPELSLPWYGISSRYDNPVGNLLGSGSYNEQNRQAGVKFAINYDMSNLVEGLTSTSSFSFDGMNLIRIGQANRYEGYRVIVGESDTTFTRLQTGISDDTRRRLHDYYYIRTAFSQSLNYERSFDNHDLQTSLTYFLYRKFSDNIRDPEPQMLGVWSAIYTYNDKYTLHGVVNYAHTYSFLKEQRGGIFPALGAGWLVSEEDFMSESNFINFLKLRAEAGIIGYDPYSNPHIVRSNFTSTTRSQFGPYPLNRWFGSDVQASPPSTYPSWVGNPALTWEKRREFNAGVDAVMFNHKLSVEVNYFNTLRDGIIGRLSNSMPDVTGMSSALPYINHNQYRYFGVEAGIQYTDRIGNVDVSLGGDITIQNSKIERYDDPNYRYDYQFRTGQPTDTYRGLNYLGRFATDEEALEVPQLFDAVLGAGDLKYEDKNNDGVVDEDDYASIGHTTPRVFYALNADIKYKNFELIVIGVGAALFDIPLTNEYFHNGWGTDNYSAFVRDNIGGAYPRLTYERVNNNFRPSTFWLTKGDYFKIKNVELAYTIPESKLQFMKSKGLRLFVRGANLLTVSSVKDIDPESPNSGIDRYPLNKTYTAGISLIF
ncbi:MAG: SusC/RagA family TonB-linked outer membrane protein [Prolixibacteraceae bacterium]|nr:SusC/RagA family TonB-linked outer membrane protein [Prolixibacteraceae bacterium]